MVGTCTESLLSPLLQAAETLQPGLQPEMQLEHGAIQIQ